MNKSPSKRRQYRTGSVYQRASDGLWIGTVEAGWTRSGARRRVSVAAKTEAACKRRLRDRQREINQTGEAVTSGRTTVKSWAETWLEITVKTSGPNTFTTDRGAINKWIVPIIGHRRLDQLNPGDMRAVAKALQDAGRSSTTAHSYHGLLRRMLKAAVQEGHRVPERVLSMEAPRVAVNDRMALSTPEVLRLLHVAADLPHGSRWALAFLQGIRQGEALGLTWDMVDLDAGTLTVSWQLQPLPYLDRRNKAKGFRVPNGHEARHLVNAYNLVRPKTTKSWRVQPLVPWAAEALTRWRDIAPPSPYGLVWPAADGRPANARDDTWEFDALQGTAGVGHPAGRYYFGHEARHSCATVLMELGVPESVRLAIMGHSTMTVTRGYEHVNIDQAREALAGVAARLQLAG